MQLEPLTVQREYFDFVFIFNLLNVIINCIDLRKVCLSVPSTILLGSYTFVCESCSINYGSVMGISKLLNDANKIDFTNDIDMFLSFLN